MGRLESVFVVVLVVAVSALAWWWPMDGGTEAEPVAVVEPVAIDASRVTVHVAGEVVRPGVVVLERGARVIDAVAAAGGVTSDAVVGAINLAAPVVDGSRIVVPGPDTNGLSLATEDDLVAVNTATDAELQTLPGVGPVMARRIIEHRESTGAFAEPEDLLDVPGIGEATLARLRPLIRVP